MRAIVVSRLGPPEVLGWRSVPDPELQPGHVMIQVVAVGVNFADLLMRSGFYPDTPARPFVPGLEVSGVIERLAPGLGNDHLGVGDRVLALTNTLGAYAERVAVPRSHVLRIPENIAFEEAAAIPVNYLTAQHAIFRMGNMQQGERVLIHSAAGGVGIAATQLAKARGLIIFGTAGPTKQNFLRQQGVDHPIDHSRQDFEKVVRQTVPDGIEMAMDPNGGKSLAKSYRCLGPMGRLVIYGFSAGVSISGNRNPLVVAKALAQTPCFRPLKLMRNNVSIIGIALGRVMRRGDLFQKAMQDILKMYVQGQIKPVIGKRFPLEQAAEAHRYIHRRENVGKVILTLEGCS
jgi:synaptic vesicle membrane protein VAT-1